MRVRLRAWKIGVAAAVVLAALAVGFHLASTPVKEVVLLPMRDGVRLATDVHTPRFSSKPLPVILHRTPYNREGLIGAAREATRRGFVFVAQDCRGRFASEGENLPFDAEATDGYDTIEWISNQPWCNGTIGTWGGSAATVTQFQMLSAGTEKIRSQHLAFAPANLYEFAYVSGIFRKALVEDWLRGTRFATNAFARWIEHPTYDSYWRERDASTDYARANFPAAHVGGYWDVFAQGTIDAFVGYQEKGGPGARGKQKLLIGPWAHGANQPKVGELSFPDASAPPAVFPDAWDWFALTLKGRSDELKAIPAVTYYVMGDAEDPVAPGNEWRTADRWPPVETTATRLFLTTDRELSRTGPGTAAREPLSYLYDPTNPVPTVGGPQLTISAGPMDQKDVEARSDVLVFSSPVLENRVEAIGRVRAKIWFSVDAPDTDLVARLCDVYPDGKSYNLCEGAVRARFRGGVDREDLLQSGKVYSVEIDLWTTAVIFNKGHRIRLHVTSSSSPAYDPNPNTGAALRADPANRPARVTIYADEEHPSHLLLPVVEK